MNVYLFPFYAHNSDANFYNTIVDPSRTIELPTFPAIGIIEDQPSDINVGGNDCRHIKGKFEVSNFSPSAWLEGNWVSFTRHKYDGPDYHGYSWSPYSVSATDLVGQTFSYTCHNDTGTMRETYVYNINVAPDGSTAYWFTVRTIYRSGRDTTTVKFYWSISKLDWDTSGRYSGIWWGYDSDRAGTSWDSTGEMSEDVLSNTVLALRDEMLIDFDALTPTTAEYQGNPVRNYTGYADPLSVTQQDLRHLFEDAYASFARDVQSYWLAWVKYPDQYQPSAHYPSLGDMCVDAANGIRTQHVNMVALIKDLYNAPTDIVGILEDTTSLKYLEKADKYRTLASMYLSGKYGPLLTIADLRTLQRNADRMKNAVPNYCFAKRDLSFTDIRGLNWSGYVRVGFNCRWSYLNELWRVADEAGLRFTAADAWDLVPYSFVVDWFVDVGGWLERRDQIKYFEKMDTFNAWLSSCVTSQRSYLEGMCTGTIEFYQRDGVHTTSCATHLETSPAFSGHLPELGALWVQHS